MKGRQHIVISNRKAKYELELVRNITVIRGNSGTGKTTLYNMIADYTRLGDASGVNVSGTKQCVALTDFDWKSRLKSISDSIVFIDEGADYLVTDEFAREIKKTDNYYVIFNRESLSALPYSVEEIYEIKTSGKYHTLDKMYRSSPGHVYGNNVRNKKFD